MLSELSVSVDKSSVCDYFTYDSSTKRHFCKVGIVESSSATTTLV